MRIATRRYGRAIVLDLCGPLSVTTRLTSLETLVGSVTGPAVNHVVLSLDQVGLLDASGIGELVRLRCVLRQSGTALTLVNVAPRQKKLLELVGLLGVLPVRNSVDEALQRGMVVA
jgi:anti-anti-sigma factor